MFAIMIRVIRSPVDSVFVQKYVIEVYVSMSFCLRAIRVIRSLVSFCLSNVFTVSKSVGHK
jgi:hypothetical protein